MKKIKKFLKETKTGGMLGSLRRSQMRGMKLMFCIFGIMALVCLSAMIVTGSISVGAMLCLAPLAGADLSQYAKKMEDLTDEEKSTLGTIQNVMNDILKKSLTGVINEEQMNERLKTLAEEIQNKQKESAEESTKAMQLKYDESLQIINTMRQDLNKLQSELKEAQEAKLNKADNEFEKSVNAALKSEQYQSFSNSKSKSTGEFKLDLKSIRTKGVVSVTGNYTGSVYPAYQSDVVVTEVPLSRAHIRDFMNVTDANNEEFTDYYYRQIYAIDRAAMAVSENGRLPEGSFKVREQHAETHRVGWYMNVSKRMLRKIALIQSQIVRLLPNGLARNEDFQILYGDDHDANFNGLVKNALTESVFTQAIYTEAAAGKVKSIASYDSGASVMVTFAAPYAKLETGMKIVFTGFQTCTALNNVNGFEMKVVNDHTIVVPCTYTAETEASVQANAKFTVYGCFGSSVQNANFGDVLNTIVSFLTFDMYVPNLIIVNPVTLNTFLSLKDNNNRPMWREYLTVVGGVYMLNGIIPVIPLDCIVKGKVFVGDFNNGCELIDTMNGYIEFAEDVETKLTNEVCSIIQEEVILAQQCPEAFMYADVANTVTAINVSQTFVHKVAITSPLNSAGDAVQVQDAE